jgi:hypothetical protein
MGPLASPWLRSQLMWSRKTDVIGSCDLYYRAATSILYKVLMVYLTPSIKKYDMI